MNNPITSFLFISISFVSVLFSLAKSQSIPSADSLSIKILDFPDSATSLSPLTFHISYNTNNRDMKLNATIGADPVDPTPRSFGDWVNGVGEITYHYRVPNHQRATGFWCTAYLTPDGSWNSRELVVTTANKVSKIIPVNYDAAWTFDVDQNVSVENTFYTTVHYAFADLRPKNIPYLVTDLVAKDQRVVARQLEYSVPESASYRQKWILPKNVYVSSLKIVARIEDETFDKNHAPIASKDGPEFLVSGATAPDFDRVAFHSDSLFIDGKPTFLHGVDIFSFWYSWADSIARRELGKMHSAGLNFARVFIDWQGYEPRIGQFNPNWKKKVAALLHSADSLKIWVELVPVGNWGDWVYTMYGNHWWTSDSMRIVNEQYYEEFGRFLDSLNVRNIYYVSMMQEGSWYFDWYDPLNGEFPKPGTGAITEADADWKSWLHDRGLAYRTFENAEVELFNRWAAERFVDLLTLRATAFRRGSKYRYAVGAEGMGGGSQYDRRWLGKHAAYYTMPELWAHVVDCLEVHNYTPMNGNGYWSGSTGLITYRDWASDFRKPVHVGEVNWTYADNNIDMGADSSWRKLKDELVLIKSLGYTGYGIWAWMDYDQRKLGLLDLQYQPRPVLDSLTKWIGVTQTTVRQERPVQSFILRQNYPNPFTEFTIVDCRFSDGLRSETNERTNNISLKVYDLFGREVLSLSNDVIRHSSIVIRQSDLPSAGCYFYRVTNGVESQTKMMVLMK